MSIPITSTIKLVHCWICESQDGLHDHHVVPQSCGGANGPTVTLCAAHHTVIHTEAYQQPIARRFRGSIAQRQKLAYLTEVIYRSFLSVQGQPKPVQKTFRLSVAQQRMWAAVRASRPGLTNDQLTLEALLEAYYQQNIAPLQTRS